MNAKEIAEFWLAQSNRDRLISLPEVEAIKQVSKAYLDLLKQHEGKVLVPVEPDEEMIEAGWNTYWDNDCLSGHEQTKLAYKAMILANTKEGKANDC